MFDFDWYALQIRPNHETAITDQLRLRGVESYYPARVHPSKRAVRPLPLFPGYLFARIDYRLRGPVLNLPHVLRLVGNERSIIPDSEIQAIRQMVDSGVGLFMHCSWEAGQRARIERGPLQGLEGLVIRHHGMTRILLSVQLISRAISAEVDAEWLSPLGRAA